MVPRRGLDPFYKRPYTPRGEPNHNSPFVPSLLTTELLPTSTVPYARSSLSLLSNFHPSDSSTTANNTAVFLAFSFRSSRLSWSFLAPITELHRYVTRSCYLGSGEDHRKGSTATRVNTSNCFRGLGESGNEPLGAIKRGGSISRLVLELLVS